jgi:hypothetical protein
LKETGREGTRKRAYDVALMLLGSEEADRIQSAVDEAYASLPGAFKTEEVRKEIAKAVVRSGGDYENRSMQECPARPRSTCRN